VMKVDEHLPESSTCNRTSLTFTRPIPSPSTDVLSGGWTGRHLYDVRARPGTAHSCYWCSSGGVGLDFGRGPGGNL